MTPAQKRLAQMMQQMQQDNAYKQIRAQRLAARTPTRTAMAQAPRPMSQASKMMNVIRRAEGGSVDTPTQTTTASPTAAAATSPVTAPQGGLPTLEELMDPNYRMPGSIPTAQPSSVYEWSAPAFGGMDQRVYDWMAPYVQAGAIIQPVRGAPAQVTVPTTYIPGIDFPATGSAGAGAGGGSNIVTPPSGGIQIGPGGIMQPGQVPPTQPLQPQPQQQVDPSIAAIYRNLLGRDPDLEGGMYWTNLLNSGVSLQDIQQGILATGEGQIAGMYQASLGRTPEAEGLAYWQSKLAAGASPAEVAAGIRASQEAQARAQTSIGDIYGNVLGRTPDQPGQQYWQEQFTQGASLADIEQGIRQSPEAQIRATYESALGREPDAAGMAYWQDAISRGASVADVQAAIRESQEARAR